MREEEIGPQPSTSALPNEEKKAAEGKSQSQSTTTETKTKKSSPNDFGYNSSIPYAPWRRKRYNLSIEGLHEEIIDLFHWVRPNDVESQIRRRVYEKVHSAIMSRWKDQKVTISMFGSLRTNLFLPSSDIDVVVECPNWQGTSDEFSEWLKATAEALKNDEIAESVTVYGGAYVPIVKMVDKDTRLSIDISFNTVQGVRAVDYIQKVKEEFPVIEPLVLILKQFLHHRHLNQTFTGGLSSYGLILMLVNFFQLYAMPMRKKHIYDKGVNLGELLIRFFEVYSQEFNYEDVGICVAQMRYVPKPGSLVHLHGQSQRNHTGTLSLEDPLLSSNDVGRSTYNFATISANFAQALQIIMVAITVRDRRRSAVWQRVYKGSMLSMIMPFSRKEVAYRNWLKGFVMTYKEEEQVYDGNIVTNTLLAPELDLSRYQWLRRLPSVQKVSRPLAIVNPEEAENMEKDPEDKEKTITAEEAADAESGTGDADKKKVEEVRISGPPTSTAISTSSTVSTAASISERDETESPPLSSVMTSSDDEINVVGKKKTGWTQTYSTPPFKKPFSEVVASNVNKQNHMPRGYDAAQNGMHLAGSNQSLHSTGGKTAYVQPTMTINGAYQPNEMYLPQEAFPRPFYNSYVSNANAYVAAVLSKNGYGPTLYTGHHAHRPPFQPSYRGHHNGQQKRSSRNSSQGSNDGSLKGYGSQGEYQSYNKYGYHRARNGYTTSLNRGSRGRTSSNSSARSQPSMAAVVAGERVKKLADSSSDASSVSSVFQTADATPTPLAPPQTTSVDHDATIRADESLQNGNATVVVVNGRTQYQEGYAGAVKKMSGSAVPKIRPVDGLTADSKSVANGNCASVTDRQSTKTTTSVVLMPSETPNESFKTVLTSQSTHKTTRSRRGTNEVLTSSKSSLNAPMINEMSQPPLVAVNRHNKR